MNSPGPRPPSGTNEAAKEAFREAFRAEQRALQAETALANLRRQMVAIAQEESPASALLGALCARVGAPRGVLWRLGQSSFEPAAAVGCPLPQLRFPAPNPFGQTTIPPRGWLPSEAIPPRLKELADNAAGIYFIPLERHLLLVGFAILGLPTKTHPETSAFEELEPLFALGSQGLHHQWELEDLAARKSALVEEVSEQRRYAQALEDSRWGVTQGDRVRLEFLRFASRSLHRGLSELLVLLKLGTDGAYSEEETGQAFQNAVHIAHHLRSVLAEVERCTETAERTVTLEPLDLGSVLRAVKEHLDRRGGSELWWPNLWTGLPKVLGDAAILQEVFATLLGLQIFHARSTHDALRIELGAQALRLRFPFPFLDLTGVVEELDRDRMESPDASDAGGPALALVVSRQLLRDLGSELRVEPEDGGSVVCVDLALANP